MVKNEKSRGSKGDNNNKKQTYDINKTVSSIGWKKAKFFKKTPGICPVIQKLVIYMFIYAN